MVCDKMSKLVVYLLDKAVWMLLATVITAQALQIAGYMETPKSASDLEYQQHYRSIQADYHRWRRDTNDNERSQFIDMLFNIPIKTLTAMNNLVQNSRPAIRKLREFVMKRMEKSAQVTPPPPPPVEKDISNNIMKRSYPVYVRPVDE